MGLRIRPEEERRSPFRIHGPGPAARIFRGPGGFFLAGNSLHHRASIRGRGEVNHVLAVRLAGCPQVMPLPVDNPAIAGLVANQDIHLDERTVGPEYEPSVKERAPNMEDIQGHDAVFPHPAGDHDTVLLPRLDSRLPGQHMGAEHSAHCPGQAIVRGQVRARRLGDQIHHPAADLRRDGSLVIVVRDDDGPGAIVSAVACVNARPPSCPCDQRESENDRPQESQ